MMVKSWGPSNPVTGFGLTLLIVGAALVGATTVKPSVFETLPSGLVALTVQLSGAFVVVMDICTCVLLTKVTCSEGTV